MDPNKGINFLDPIFEAKVRCSCTEDDFHPAENLVSNDKQKLSRGFMAYSVVKPPIDLEFKLSCCIELISIKIWPQIDSLKSTGFEIHANGGENPSDYRKIGSYFNLRENGIQFVNNRMSESNSCDSNFATVSFYSSVSYQLRKVKNIKIFIKQTTRFCAPAIRKIEIWGKISKFATNEQQQFINQAILRDAEEITANTTIEQNEGRRIQRNEDLCAASVVPEEFLDAITYEVMALPMVLPSGKTIDNSTIFKHTDHEGKWGRVPSDPFTGQPFTETRKPVLNIHLKSQIDSFLLRNCSVPEVSMLPRTVGSISKRRIEPTNEFEQRQHKITKTSTVSTSIRPQLGSSSSLPNILQAPSPSLSSFLPGTTGSTQSLDDAVRAVLTHRKYTTTSTTTHCDSNPNGCFQCRKSVGNVLYTIITCTHLICRNCLVNENRNSCKCGQEFSNIDVNRYHDKNIL